MTIDSLKSMARFQGAALRAFAVGAAVGAMTLIGAAAHAQDMQVTDQQVNAFARASLAVQEINSRWAPRIQNAENSDEAAEIRRQAVERMAAAVEAEGLDVQTYNQIYTMAQNDPELAEQITEQRQELQ